MKYILFVLTFYFCGSSTLAEHKHPNPECKDIKLETNPIECCKKQRLFDEAIENKCLSEFGMAEDAKMSAPTGCCIAECILNATGILVNGKTVDKTILASVLTKTAEEAFVPVIQKAIETCDSEIKELMKAGPEPPPTDIANKRCHPLSGKMVGCLAAEIFLNCPNYGTDSKCAALKTQIEKCPFALLNLKP